MPLLLATDKGAKREKGVGRRREREIEGGRGQTQRENGVVMEADKEGREADRKTDKQRERERETGRSHKRRRTRQSFISINTHPPFHHFHNSKLNNTKNQHDRLTRAIASALQWFTPK